MTPGERHVKIEQHGTRDNFAVENMTYYAAAEQRGSQSDPEPDPLVVLLVGASPYDIELGRVRADREFRELQLNERGSLRPIARPAAQPSALDAVVDLKAAVLHLSMHCDGDVMQFERPDGDRFPVRVGAVAERLRIADAGLRGLVLSTCWGNRYVERFADLAETVVAWEGELDDDVAVAFAGEFYRLLSNSATPDLGKSAELAALTVQDMPVAEGLEVVGRLIVLRRNESMP